MGAEDEAAEDGARRQPPIAGLEAARVREAPGSEDGVS